MRRRKYILQSRTMLQYREENRIRIWKTKKKKPNVLHLQLSIVYTSLYEFFSLFCQLFCIYTGKGLRYEQNIRYVYSLCKTKRTKNLEKDPRFPRHTRSTRRFFFFSRYLFSSSHFLTLLLKFSSNTTKVHLCALYVPFYTSIVSFILRESTSNIILWYWEKSLRIVEFE